MRHVDPWLKTQGAFALTGETLYCSYDKDEITDEMAELLQPYLEHKDFSPGKTRLLSSVAGALCTWVLSMMQYHDIARTIKPRMDALRMSEMQMISANKCFLLSFRACLLAHFAPEPPFQHGV